MSERTAEATTTVDEDGIRVEKSFTDDAFPVPAVMYELSSDRDEPVRVRIVDRIPESFPMDRIGFHPEYESENWTAYKDHRVEFERVLEPGEAIETVFGIRDDDPDLDSFLGTPVIEHVPVGEEIEDVLGAGDTDAVREVLAGDRATLPGMEEPLAAEAPGDAERDAESDTEPVEDDVREGESVDDDAPSPRDVEAGTAAVTPRATDDGSHDEPDAEPVDDSAESDAPEADVSEADAPEAEVSEADASEADVSEEDDEATELEQEEPAIEEPTDSEPEPAAADIDTESDSGKPAETPTPAASEGSLAATLASEIRSGDVADEDLETLRSELDVGVPKSVDVRIARLQSSVADIEAYADALAEFIDGEGTAREILDELDRKVEAVESEMATLDDRLDEAGAARDEMSDEVSRVDESVAAVSADVDEVTERVDGVTHRVDDVETDVSTVEESVGSVEETVDEVTNDVSRIDGDVAALGDSVEDLGDDVVALYEEIDDNAAGLEATEERVDGVESRLDRFDEEFDDLWDDLAEVDTRLTEIEDRLGEDLDDVQAEIDEINDHLEELDAFRTRLNEAFGP